VVNRLHLQTPAILKDFAILGNPEIQKNMSYVQNVRVLGDLLFPKKWMQENPNYVEKLPKPGRYYLRRKSLEHGLYRSMVQAMA
jgi:hypothetical protein